MDTKADVILKEFWRDNAHFADLFNAVIYGGKEVIKAEELEEMDTDVSGSIKLKGYEETLTRTRDVIKKRANDIEYVVLGIESQKHIHYAMPLRNMIYDALSYLKEYNTMQNTTAGGKTTVDSFLSKMTKEQKLHPIITITVYYGEHKWDGPLCLRDMVGNMSGLSEALFCDYKMNLLQVIDSEQYHFNDPDVNYVFDISRALLKGEFSHVKEHYKDIKIKNDILTIIGKITNTKQIVAFASSEKEEVGNMCTALEKLADEVRAEGIKEGRAEGRVEERAKLIQKLHENGLTLDEISKILELPINEVSDLLECKICDI